jgi:hypothetical protein
MAKKQMGYLPLAVKIVHTQPQLMHSGRLKSPLDPWAKGIRRFSSKRKKIEDDHIGMMEAEYKGSLYLFEDPSLDSGKASDGKFPYWPHDNIHACIKTQAKDKKMGKVIDSAMVVKPPGGRLIYDGPKTRDELWEDPKFRLVKPTRRGTMCCRPKFDEWSVEFQILYLPEKLSVDELKQIIVEAGKYVGLSEWPRRYGLFEVEGFSEKEVEIDVTC